MWNAKGFPSLLRKSRQIRGNLLLIVIRLDVLLKDLYVMLQILESSLGSMKVLTDWFMFLISHGNNASANLLKLPAKVMKLKSRC